MNRVVFAATLCLLTLTVSVSAEMRVGAMTEGDVRSTADAIHLVSFYVSDPDTPFLDSVP